MAISSAEIKRKIFHNLAIGYMLMYAFLPRWLTLFILGVVLIGVGTIEFLRLRRPEINAWFLKRFGGIHRGSEVMQPSGVFWTLLGCWSTMVVFQDEWIVLAAIGFMTFGDTAAALGGQKWGNHSWPKNPAKTFEGSACFVLASLAWVIVLAVLRPGPFYVNWPIAVIGTLVCAWVETLPLPWNDNFWLPTGSALLMSGLGVFLGRF